jgi:hypothetical protein
VSGFCQIELLEARRRILIEASIELLVFSPVLAASEVVIECTLRRWYPMQSTTQAWLFFTYLLILLSCYHLVFYKLRFYYLRIAVLIVAYGVILQQFFSWVASLIGCAQRPIFLELLAFLSCRILNWCR